MIKLLSLEKLNILIIKSSILNESNPFKYYNKQTKYETPIYTIHQSTVKIFTTCVVPSARSTSFELSLKWLTAPVPGKCWKKNLVSSRCAPVYPQAARRGDPEPQQVCTRLLRPAARKLKSPLRRMKKKRGRPRAGVFLREPAIRTRFMIWHVLSDAGVLRGCTAITDWDPKFICLIWCRGRRAPNLLQPLQAELLDRSTAMIFMGCKTRGSLIDRALIFLHPESYVIRGITNSGSGLGERIIEKRVNVRWEFKCNEIPKIFTNFIHKFNYAKVVQNFVVFSSGSVHIQYGLNRN